MALPASGQLGIVQISTYRYAGTGWGGGGTSGANNMNYYAGRNYYTSSGLFSFPTSNLKITNFYGTSPVDEWNCVCVCDCACGK